MIIYQMMLLCRAAKLKNSNFELHFLMQRLLQPRILVTFAFFIDSELNILVTLI